jgi:hypothetical protein
MTMDVPPPDDLYRAVAVEQAIRWGYTTTLGGADLAAFIRRQAEDSNLRADADVAWRYAQKGKADGD